MDLDEMIGNAVRETQPLSQGFTLRTAEKMLARRERKIHRRLYAWGAVYFLVALSGTFGLSLLISGQMASALWAAALSGKAYWIFGLVVFGIAIALDRSGAMVSRKAYPDV